MVNFNPSKDIPDLSGKVVFVTGGNAGLGAATVEAVAAHNPARLYLGCRRVEAGEQLAEKVRQKHPNANLRVLKLDLNSLASVKACAEQFNQESNRLDILFNNAGISGQPAALTADGIEIVFGVNHVAHQYFTLLLMPKLLQTKKTNPDVRIVNVSSVAARSLAPGKGMLLDQAKTNMENISQMARYGHSKLANVLFAKKLSQLYPDILTTSIHPGTVKSDIWDKATELKTIVWLMQPIIWFTGVDIHEGAKNQLWAAFGDGVKNGTYYEPVGKEHAGTKNMKDQKQADELWDWTNKELTAFGAPSWPSA
ncbi:NAD(P)-binding protein [Polychaeton citri CBS 116435]|uniref:NAD(P)-binding protein n=1 Tax=Polychaeton citri CBS 116435 TaxID=1314669 RepID=A0A9P4US48_9PEZI|nr:NAD(P)-binding protein [Polychaeton citri CBS 116435]